ncbi:MAG: RNA 3'-terminal phosphate cyclase [Candidatus Micrarchaeota archaeon]
MAVEIDGSYGESGGQILRTSLTLSAITQKPFRISNIRAKRSNPGLRSQHLTACKAVRKVCRGTLTGAELESTELSFEPGPIVGGKYDLDIGTAGSVTLVAQTLIPILLKASKPSELSITGGTHVMKAPGYDYFERVFLPAIRLFGADVETKLIRTGYYPKGGGKIELTVKPSQLKGHSSWLQDEHVTVLIRLADLPLKIAIREKKVFMENDISHIMIREEHALSPGNAVTAWRGFRGAYSLGEKGKRADIVAKEALDALNAEKWDVDMHLADQLLLYAALAEGPSSYRASQVTEHLKTNAYVISRFIERKIDLDEGKIRVD